MQSRHFQSLAEGHPGPGLFPGILGGSLALAGLMLFVSGIRKPGSNSKGDLTGNSVLRFMSGLIIVCIFPVISGFTGFIPAVGLVCFCLGLLLKVHWWKSAIASGGAALLIFLIFSVLLGVPL
jgi:hypothetical protein